MKTKWSTQWVKISVKELAPEDQHDLSKALVQSDNIRDRLKSLTKRLKQLHWVKMRELLLSKVGVWRNMISHSLEYFIERFLYPLKELGVEGRRYLVFLEDFEDSNIRNRVFTILSNNTGFGDISKVRYKMFSEIETID